MTRTANNARTEYRAANTDKGAILHPNGSVAFGRWERESRDGRTVESFVCRPFNTTRSYKSAQGAERAIAKWLAA